jgi:hypothetical protein
MPKSTNQSDWYKNCPNCNIVIYYSSKYNLHRSLENNTKCRSCKMSGKIHTATTRQKISRVQFGRIPWNKGKNNIYSTETLKRMSDAFKGKPSPKKGITLSTSTKQKISKSLTGKKASSETKHKMSVSQLGRVGPMKGKTHTLETRLKMSTSRLGKISPMLGKNIRIKPNTNSD